MQLKTLALAAFALLVPAAFGTPASTSTSSSTVTVSYDQVYDKASGSLSTVACSDGTHGLLTKGYSTFGSLPHFPHIGGAAVVAGWNSASCGTCWELSYKGKNVTVLAVDHAKSGWNIALGAMDALTGGNGKQLGRIEAIAKQVDKSKCGL
ncbi:Cerato-platanin-domain-containing protein [Cubamyces lactineus]|nr:Cerato-platanin-domain-containing protein [Cubamyces lactineus]